MKCPKCGHEQEDVKVCEACGLVFEKYLRYREMLEQSRQAQPVEQPQRGGGRLLGLGAVVVTAIVVGGFMMFKGNEAPPAPAQAQPSVAVQETMPPMPSTGSTDDFSGKDLVAKLNETVPPRNPIEQARNATVLI